MLAHSPTIPNHQRGRRMSAVLGLAIIYLIAAAPARADYGPGAEAVSANGSLLGGDVSSSPSISDDGRYVVFSTQAVNLLGSPPGPGERYTAGIVRRDMVTGAVELVAPPARVGPDGAARPGASVAGSISGNGRYVLFDTPEQLAPGDRNASGDVYVRDMTRSLTDGSAYELVSALDGTDSAPDYLDTDQAKGSRSGRQGFAISDDGRRAVFRTEARSNLPTPSTSLAPPAQVLVRLLDTKQTLLMTRSLLDGKPVAAVGGTLPNPDPVLSGDGTAVAWADANPAAQVPLLRDEPAVPAILWRDLTTAGAPARRVAGRSDPDDPGCPPGGPYPNSTNETDTGPCYGPFVASEALQADNTLIGASSISDDGRRLLLQTEAHQRPFDGRNAGRIVYLADMRPGLTRKQGVTRILRGLGAEVGQATLAGGGTRLAFTSLGSVFEGPRAVGSFPSGVIPATNVFVMDLEQSIVQRVTIGSRGTDLRGRPLPEQPNTFEDPGPTGLALSDDAGAIAFQSKDANLFLGDANNVADVQVVRGAPGVTTPRSAFSASDPPTDAPPGGELTRSVKPLSRVHTVIGVITVDSRGAARLNVRVPAAGRVRATASAPRGRGRLRVAYATRKTLASATVHLRLTPTQSARKAARRSRRLRVRVDVRYTPVTGRSTAAIRSYTLPRGTSR